MRLLTLFGVNLRLNVFFILLFFLYWYLGVLGQAMVIFTVVFLHEIGHVVAAIGYGVKVTEVELLPFGGVARVEGNFELNPVIESYIGLAGPITNGFLALLGLILDKLGVGNQQWLPFFIHCNLMLGAFNLLPAIPLDGGRIMRAALSRRWGIKKATDRAALLSTWIGIAMAFVGLRSVLTNEARNFNFLVIALFLIYFAAREKGSAMYLFMKFLTRKKEDLFREGVLLTRQVVALESTLLKDIVKYFVPQKYHLVVVVGKNHSVRGTLTEGEIIDGMMTKGQDLTVGNLVVMEK